MKKFSQLNEGYQIHNLDSNQLLNDLKDIGTNIEIELKFLKLNYNGSIYGGSEWIEYQVSDFSSPKVDDDEYLFIPHFYLTLKLNKLNYDSNHNFITNSSDNIEFSGAYSIFPFLDQLSKLKEILKKYEDNYHVLLYEGHDDDLGGGSSLKISESLLKIEILGKDPLEINDIIKFIKK